MFISSDFTFYSLYGDIYFSMVIAQATRIRMILRKTPLKVYSNLKIDYFMHISAMNQSINQSIKFMKKTGVEPTCINRNEIVYFKAILSLVKVDSNKIGF